MDTLFWLNFLRKTMLAFPDTEEYLCYGTPAFRVKKKLIIRLREDGETLVVHADDRDIWLAADPKVFYVTEHYYNYPYVLVRLNKVSEAVLEKVVTEAWMQRAPVKVIDEYLKNNK